MLQYGYMNIVTNDSHNTKEKILKIKFAYSLFTKEALEINKKILSIEKNVKVRKLRSNMNSKI